MKHIFDLTNNVPLITGGGTGIGKGIAEEFLNLGEKVVITGRDRDKLNKIQEKLASNFFTYVNDVTKKEEHETLITNIEDNKGPLDILVNNTGRHCIKPSIETTDEEFQAVIDSNVNSVFALTRIALKFMIQRKKGSIISIYPHSNTS